ncbi:hypothetical protein ACTMTI_28290 [Nonomuraea sp. H19]|uniref:hypothetical protein n=1 Tax=Nonomuraea sp. H19 TaxID=3452206 RepID=UPI003F88BEA0
MSDIAINGLPLPAALRRAIHEGRWAPPDPAVLLAVFGEKPVQPRCYGVAEMEFENDLWLTNTDALYLGSPDPARPPGDLDPKTSLLIGDLGPDMPFALDYRVAGAPTVVYLTLDGVWVTVAPSIDALLRRFEADG